MIVRPSGRAVAASAVSTSTSYRHCLPSFLLTALTSSVCGSHVNSGGAGHLMIGTGANLHSALTRFVPVFSVSEGAARTAWRKMLRAAKRLGVKHQHEMSIPQGQKTSEGYKRASVLFCPSRERVLFCSPPARSRSMPTARPNGSS
jgi:hypothetical protein